MLVARRPGGCSGLEIRYIAEKEFFGVGLGPLTSKEAGCHNRMIVAVNLPMPDV